MPQVIASTAAAVSGAFAASGLGVYGTIIGAGVISIVATVGGALYQRLFDKTGEQLREVARPRQRGARSDIQASDGGDSPRGRPRTPAEHGHVPAPAAARQRTTHHATEPETPTQAAGYTAPTEYGTPRRRRLLRRRLVMAAGVFVLAMAAVTGIELATGTPAPSTSVGDLFNRDHGGSTGGTDEDQQDGPGPGDDSPTDPGGTESELNTPGTPAPNDEEPPQRGEPGGTAPGAPEQEPNQPGTPGGDSNPSNPGSGPGESAEPSPTQSNGSGNDGGSTQDGSPPEEAPDGGAAPEE